jgi:hypothetical protein
VVLAASVNLSGSLSEAPCINDIVAIPNSFSLWICVLHLGLRAVWLCGSLLHCSHFQIFHYDSVIYIIYIFIHNYHYL